MDHDETEAKVQRQLQVPIWNRSSNFGEYGWDVSLSFLPFRSNEQTAVVNSSQCATI